MKNFSLFLLVLFSFLLSSCSFLLSGLGGTSSYTFVNKLSGTVITQIKLEPADNINLFSNKIHSCRISYNQSTVIQNISDGKYRVYITIDGTEYLANKGTELIVNHDDGELQLKYKQALEANLKVRNTTSKTFTSITWSTSSNFSDSSTRNISIKPNSTATISLPEGSFYLKFGVKINEFQTSYITYKNQFSAALVELEKGQTQEITVSE